MVALTADRQTPTKNVGLKGYPVAASTEIFKGSLVCLDAGGDLIPASDTAGISAVVGVADEHVDNSAGADGDLECRVRSGLGFQFAATAITVAMLGDAMYVVDDQTFDDSQGTNAIVAGHLIEFISATEGVIFIPLGGSGLESPAAPIGANESFATTVTGITVVDGIVTSVTGT